MNFDQGLLHHLDWRQVVQGHLEAQEWTQAWEALQALATMEPQSAWVQQWRVAVALALLPPKPQLAIVAAQLALQLLPDDDVQARADVLFNLAQAYGLVGQAAQSVEVFDQLLALQPSRFAAMLGRAKGLASLGHHAAAGRAVTQALSSEPQNLEALALLANTLVKAAQPARALQVFAQHERAKPFAPFVACAMVFLSRQLGQWQWPDLPLSHAEGEVLQRALAQGQAPELALLAHRAWRFMPAIEPFACLVLYDDPALQRHVAQQFLQYMHPPLLSPERQKSQTAVPERDPKAVLKVAYLSCEFCEHATSYMLAGVLARHNPARVQVVLLSYASASDAATPDAMQQRIRAMGHTWVDVSAWTDAQVAQWCRDHRVDVLVDLKGLTRDARPGILAYRAAPVQVNWLGYPGTMPAPYVDWVLADSHVLPPSMEPHFAERVWRLPHSYQPSDPDRLIDPRVQCRAEHGLPEQGLVLACFGCSYTFTPEVWAMWMRLLRSRPDAVLWMHEGPPELPAQLRGHAQSAGIAPDRLVFAHKLAQPQHLSRLQLADLSLDTCPFNANTMASDALWAGVPHVACTGQSFASRVGASVLAAAGMPELITHSLQQYEALALQLLLDDDARLAVRQRLAAQRGSAPLWDVDRFVADLESAWQAMCAVQS